MSQPRLPPASPAARAPPLLPVALALVVITAGLAGGRFWFEGAESLAGRVLLLATLSFGTVALVHRHPVAPWLLPGFALVALCSLAGTGKGLLSEAMVWLPFVSLVARVFVPSRGAVIFSGLGLAVVAMLTAGHLAGLLVPLSAGELVAHAGAVAGAVAFSGFLVLALEQQRLRTIQALRVREARQLEVVQALPHALIVCEAGGELTVARNLHTVLPGLATRPVEGSLEELLGPQLAAPITAAQRRAREQGEAQHLRLSVGEGGEAREVEALILALHGGRAAALFQDVTEQVRLDRAKDEFVSTVSHELRSPLAAVYASLRLVNSGVLGALEPGAARALEVAEGSAARLGRLVDDLLDLQKMQAGEMRYQPVEADLDETLAAAVAAYAARADEAGVTVHLARAAPARLVHDRDRIEQVVLNLLSNAVKHSPPGGTVHLRLQDLGERVRVEVEDRGPGIPEEARETVFAAFGQLDGSATRRVGGTGLGLAIAARIVAAHGGLLDFESTVGEGTTFSFELPRSEDGAAAPSAAAAAAAAAAPAAAAG